MTKQEYTPLDRLPNKLPWVVGIVAFALAIVYVCTFHKLPWNESPSAWGSFGDYVGGLLNPLVSTFTLIVAVKVWAQQKTELEETKKALEDQAKTSEQNRREQRFFDLMQVYQQALDTFQEMSGGHAKHGKPALDKWLKENEIFSRPSPYPGLHNPLPDRLNAHYKNWGDECAQKWQKPEVSGKFDHYFRVIFRILQDAESLLGEDRYRFMRLFRAQLSRSELILLSWNLWQSTEGKKMLGIAGTYGLLKHLPRGVLRDTLEDNLPANVFGRKFVAREKPQKQESPC